MYTLRFPHVLALGMKNHLYLLLQETAVKWNYIWRKNGHLYFWEYTTMQCHDRECTMSQCTTHFYIVSPRILKHFVRTMRWLPNSKSYLQLRKWVNKQEVDSSPEIKQTQRRSVLKEYQSILLAGRLHSLSVATIQWVIRSLVSEYFWRNFYVFNTF